MSGSDNKVKGSNSTDAFGSSADHSFNSDTDTTTNTSTANNDGNNSNNETANLNDVANKTVNVSHSNSESETKTVSVSDSNNKTTALDNVGNKSLDNVGLHNSQNQTTVNTSLSDVANKSLSDVGNKSLDNVGNHTLTDVGNHTLTDVGNKLYNSDNTSSENQNSFNTHTEADSYSHNNGSFDNTWNTTTTTISTSIANDISHAFNGYDNVGGTTLVMPEDISQSLSGSANSLAIALDQVNELVSNNSANHDWVQNSASDAIDSHDLSANGGDANHNAGTDNMSSNASGAANLDAFTQSIVLGANLQNNSFSLTVSGHDSLSDGSSIHHSHA